MARTMKFVSQVVAVLIENDAYVATKYVTRSYVVRATRKLFKRKIDSRQNIEIMLTIGRPNYQERDFVKSCTKSKEPFPVRKIQLRYPPKLKK